MWVIAAAFEIVMSVGGSYRVSVFDANFGVAMNIQREWLQGIPETAKLHFVELAAPPNKHSREGQKGGVAKAQALSKAYSSFTSVLLALKQQRRKHSQDASRCICCYILRL